MVRFGKKITKMSTMRADDMTTKGMNNVVDVQSDK
jgi:hypothetical protein